MTRAMRTFSLAIVLFLSPALFARPDVVHVREGTIDLPTYLLGKEDPNPPFPLVNRHEIYPYTMLDDLTDRRELKTYRAAFLENEYLKAIILPDLGGRLYSLYDKAAKREVFYRNHVVKYGLVALRGAWISGGVEFNFPNGHTVVTVSPVELRVQESPDGSASVVVGGMDWVTDMHWEVALTLRPGQARLEQHVTLFNSTPLDNLYWYWANAAVPATEDMQFIYPMREANPHSRTEVWGYPVWQGVDYGWYKNIRQPTSLFGRQVHRNFFGAYYHDSDYGVVHVADFREVPGKKIWSWGVAGDGLIWTDLLTDHDGPYNEIQSGRYETQLNQEFMSPHRVESWTEYWYPVRGLAGGFVEATRDVALNVRFLPAEGTDKPRVDILVDPTVDILELPASGPHGGASVRVLLGDKLLQETKTLDFHAGTTAKLAVTVEDIETAKKTLVVEIVGADKRSLLRWSAADPVDGNLDFVPAAGVHAVAPRPIDKMTVDELFQHGVLQEKNSQPDAALRTYQEVLERDPLNIPALLKLAWQDYRAANLPSEEQRIARAMSRNSVDPAVHYAAGVIYRASGRLTLAQDALWASIQYGGPPAPAYAQLGEISIQQKNYEEAAKLLRQALDYNPEDAMALADLAVAMRLDGKVAGAAQAAGAALEKMPLLPFALAEARRIVESGSRAASLPALRDQWDKPFPLDVQYYLEVAAWYLRLGDLNSAFEFLHTARDRFPSAAVPLKREDQLPTVERNPSKELGDPSPQDFAGTDPMLDYYLAAAVERGGQMDRAKNFMALAAKKSPVKVFPNRLDDALVLADALVLDPADGRVYYCLGNFFFAHGRYDDGAKAWLQALGNGFDDAVLERNLGVHAWRVKNDLKGAAAYYGKAIQLAPHDHHLYVDLDEIYAQLGDNAKRAALFAKTPNDVLERDTVRVRRALLLIEEGHCDEALETLARHRFKPWEGGEIVRQVFVRANITTGKRALANQDYAQAEQAFRRALEYPVNLGVGKPDKPHDEEALYWLGEALAVQDKVDEARNAWRNAATTSGSAAGVAAVFRAAALGRLGQTEESSKALATFANPGQENTSAYDFYVAGLAEQILGHEDEAQKAFAHALELDRSFWPARVELRKP